MTKAPVFATGVTVGFSDLYNATPTVEMARVILAQYDRQSVLLLLAKLSASLKLWSLPDYGKDNGFACDVFKAASKVKYQTLSGNPNRIFFTRLGVLATARLALTASSDTGRKNDQPTQAAQILLCCLMMNELTASSEPLRGTADLLVHHLPNHNAMAHYDFRADLLRSLELFERNRELLGEHAGLLDLEQAFTRATGLTPRRFVEMCLIFAAPYRAITAASLVTDDPTFLVDRNRFGNLKISDADFSAFFKTIARTDAELAELLGNQGARPLADTTIFQSFPVIRLQNSENYYCLDIAALMGKTGRGLYWTLFATADKNTKGRLGGAYGLAFEAYLHKRAAAAGFSAPYYLPNPRFRNGDEACDAIFVTGSSLVFCEYKSSVLKADAKLSGRLDQLAPEIDKKFVSGDDDGRKGTAQLIECMARLFRGEEIEDLPSRKWTMVFPVMICLESAMICSGMSGYLNRCFDRSLLKSLSSTKITPLTVIDVENFEALLPDIRKYGFNELLDDYYRFHVQRVHDQIVPFHRDNIPFLGDKPESTDERAEAFRRFFGNLGARVFGVEDSRES